MAHLCQLGSIQWEEEEEVTDNMYTKKMGTVEKFLKLFQNKLEEQQIRSNIKKESKYMIMLVIKYTKLLCDCLMVFRFDLMQDKVFREFNFLIQLNPLTFPTKSLRKAFMNAIKILNKLFSFETFSINIETGELYIKNIISFYKNQLQNNFSTIFNKIIIDGHSIVQKVLALCEQYNADIPSVGTSQCQDKEYQERSIIHKYYSLSFMELGISNSNRGLLLQSQVNERQAFQKFLNQSKQNSFLNCLKMYTNFQQYQPKMVLSEDQISELAPIFHFPKPKINNPHQNQFIFNQIQIEEPHNLQMTPTNLQGGNSNFYLAKIKFSYSLWQNIKSNCQLEKYMLIKYPKRKSSKTQDHEKRIIEIFHQSISGYMLKYYTTTQQSKIKGVLLMDYTNSPSLHIFSILRRQSISFGTKLTILGNLANGLRFLKRYCIVHMDLNPNNILIAQKNLPKIIDFGEAYSQTICDKNYAPGYTIPFCPPECFTTKKFTTKSDVFSWGIIMFKLLFDKLPYQVTQQLKTHYKKKTYSTRLFFAPESLLYIQRQRLMIYIFQLFNKTFQANQFWRPYATWCRMIVKLILEEFFREF